MLTVCLIFLVLLFAAYPTHVYASAHWVEPHYKYLYTTPDGIIVTQTNAAQPNRYIEHWDDSISIIEPSYLANIVTITVTDNH